MTEAEWFVSTDPLALTNWLFFDALASDRKLRLFAVACCRPVIVHARQFAAEAAHVLALTEGLADGHMLSVELNQHCENLLGQWRGYDDDLSRLYRQNQEGWLAELNSLDVSFWFTSQCLVNALVCGSRHVEERDRTDSQYRRRDFYQGVDRRSFPFAAAAEAAEAAVCAVEQDSEVARERARIEAKEYQVCLLRDIFGNPFRPLSLDHSWHSSTVISLAQAAYDNRTFPDSMLDLDRLSVLADALEDSGCTDAGMLEHLRAPGAHVRGCFAVDLLLGKN